MYPKADGNSYYPRPVLPQPSVMTGIPVNSTDQFYPISDTTAFELHSKPPTVQWSTGLCDCCDDVSNCCLTCCCPCITFGQIAEVVDQGSTSCGTSGALYTLISLLTACGCMYSCFYRSKMRAQYSLQESPCNDCLVHCCCEACALCQEYRELRRRGFDMRIGWHANMERQGGEASVMTPPATDGGMSR